MHETLNETPTTRNHDSGSTTSSNTSTSTSNNPVKNGLREMTFEQGEKALSPVVDGPVQVKQGETNTEVTGGDGEVTTSGAGTAIVDNNDPTKTQNGAPPEDGKGGKGKKTEVEQVAEVHGQTVDALVRRLKEMHSTKQKVFVWRKEKKIAEDAKSLFGLLSGYDSQTITAAWQVAKGDAEAKKAFETLVEAIGTRDAARSYPREARATLMACEPARLQRFAEDTVKKNPFACKLAVALLPEDARKTFEAAHPELETSKKLKEGDDEKLDAELLTLKDASLRQSEEGFRERMTSAKEGDAKKAEDAKKGENDAAPLVEKVKGLAGQKKFQEALVALSTEGGDAVFLPAVRLLDTGLLSSIIRGMTFDQRWNQSGDHVKRVFGARDSANNIADARNILDVTLQKTRVVVDKKGREKTEKRSAISSAEAYEAYHLLKAMPAAHRELFQKVHPDLVVAMEMNLNASMRAADDTNMLGEADQATAASLTVKLRDDKLWLEAPVDQLEMTLRMAVKLNLRGEIKAKLESMKGGGLETLAADSARKSAVEGALGKSEVKELPDGLPEGEKWLATLKLQHVVSGEDGNTGEMKIFGEKSLVRTLRHANKATREENKEERKAWKEAKKNGEEVGPEPDKKNPSLIGQAWNAIVTKKGFEAENLALDQLGGNVGAFGYGADIEFKDYGERKGDNSKEDRNRADIKFQQNEGVFEFKCPQLELVKLRYPMGDMVVETGPAMMVGVNLVVTWPTPSNPEQIHSVKVAAQKVEIGNIMVTQPGAIIGIKSLSTGALNYSSGEQKFNFSDNPGAAEALALLKEYNPARTLLSFGLASAGMTGKKKQEEAGKNLEALATAFTGKPGGSLGGMALDCDGMSATGITYNDDVFVQKAEVGKVDLVWDNRPSVTGAKRMTHLGAMIETATGKLNPGPDKAPLDDKQRARLEADIERWTAERNELQGKVEGWKALEALYQEIYEHQKVYGAGGNDHEDAVKAIQARAKAAGFAGADSMSLAQLASALQAKLTSDSGLVASVESVSVEGVDAMGTQVDKASVTGINVSGQGETFGEAANPALMKRLGSEDGETSNKGKPIGTSATLDVAGVDVSGVKMAGATPDIDTLKKTKTRMGELVASVAALSEKSAPSDEDKAKLKKDKEELEALQTQWGKGVGDGLTYGQVVEELIGLSEKPGLAAVKKDPDQLQRLRQLEDALRGEPLTVESIVVAGISMKGETTSEKTEVGTNSSTTTKLGIGSVEVKGVKSGDMSVGSISAGDIKADGKVDYSTNDATKETSMSGSGSFSVGTLGAKDIKAGGNSVDEVSVTGLQGSGSLEQKTKTVKGEDGKDKEEVLERTANGSLDVEKVTAKGVDAGGTKVQEAGLEKLNLSLCGDGQGTELGLSFGKAYATGVGQEKGLASAKKQIETLDAEIARLKGQGKDPKEQELAKKKLEDGLASYRQAYDDQDLVLAEVKAIDEKIDATKLRLKAAQRELETYDHRVDAVAEKQKNEADQKRVEAIQKELDALAKERAEIQKKLVEPQKVIASFESSLGIEGTASIENFDLKVSGLPTLKELSKEDPDLGSSVNIKLGVGPITIPTIDYQSPGMNVGLKSASVPRIEADATVKIEKGKPDPEGKTTWQLGAVDIKNFSIPSIVGNELTLTMPVEGEKVEIKLPKATITGMALKDVHLPGFDAASLNKATGRFDIKSIETSMSASMGDSLKANGSLKVTDIHAEALASGAVNFGLKGLTLDGLGFESKSKEKTASGNTIVSSIVKMGGKASKLGKIDIDGTYDRVNKTLSTTVTLGDLVLSGIDYRGGGTHVGVGYAQLKGASVTVGAKFRSGEPKEGESALEYLDISEVKADYLRGSSISYTGSGTRRERFQDGTLKETPFSTTIGLKKGTLHGFSVKGIRVIGDGLTNISANLGSGSVEGLNVSMKEHGKNVLQANVTAAVSGVSVKLVDDDMTASFSSFKGDASVTSGDGENAMNFDVKGVDVRGDDKQKATVSMTNMGKESASMDATLPVVHAREIGFEQGIKGSGYNKPFMLGTATLNDVKFHDDKDKLSVDIGKGQGLMLGGVEVTGSYSGSSQEEKDKAQANGTTKDQFFVPTQKVTWNNLQKSTLDGFLRLNYPDKSQFLKLNFANSGVTLDLQENIDRMWSEWHQGFERDGESTFAYLWKATKTVLQTPGNLLWHALFRGLEKGFNALAANLLGSWPEIEKMILESLNTNPKTSIVAGHKPDEGDKTFTSFTSSINKVIQDYVEPAIETACDWGLVYDLIHGDYGRAAKTTGAWLLEQGGNLIDWGGSLFGYDNVTNVDDDMEKYQEEMRAQRKAEMEAMVKSGLDKVLGWGMDLDLHTKGGDYQALKQPNPNPGGVQAREMLRTQLALDLSGGGTLKDMSLGTRIGLSKFKYSDAGNTATIDKLTMTAAANGGAKHEFEDDGVRMKDAKLSAGGGVLVNFEGLHYEQDKNFATKKPEGTTTAQDRYKMSGTSTDVQSQSGNPLATNDGVYYDAGDYANRVNSGQGVVGETYSEQLSMGEGIKKKAIEYTLDPLSGLPISKVYESQTIKAKNAQVYGKYQTQYDEQQKKNVAAK